MVVLALAGAFLLAGCAGPRPGSLRPLRAPTRSEGIVVFVSGGVQVLREGTWTDVEPGDPVGPGTVIRTDEVGDCEIRFGDSASVRLDPGSQVRWDDITVEAQPVVGGELIAGTILAKVTKLVGTDLKVRTPSTVVGVRGTEVMVRVAGDATEVTVREGMVSVAYDGASLDLHAGERARAVPGATATRGPAAPEDLAAIEAFVPSGVDTGDARHLMKVLLQVVPDDASIHLGPVQVGRGSWGAVLEDGTEVTLVLRRDGYRERTVTVRAEGGKALLLTETLEPSGGQRGTPPEGASAEPKPTGPEAAPTAVPGSTVAAAKEPEAPAATPPVAARRIVFRVDPAIGDDPFFQEAAARFAERVPGFSLLTAAGSENAASALGPRGFEIIGGVSYEHLPALVAAGRIRPLDGFFDPAALSPPLVDAVRVGGTVWGLPLGGHSPILYFNRDLVRDPPRTWADIATLSAEYSEKGVDALAIPSLEPLYMGMFPESLGVRLLDPDTDRSMLGTAPAALAFDALRDAVNQAGLPWGLDRPEALSRFLQRRAVLYVDGVWVLDDLRKSLGDSLGMATLPTWGTPGRPLRPYVNALALFVSRAVSDERAERLLPFFRFLLEGENQLRLMAAKRIAPALRGVAREAEMDPVAAVLHRQLQTAVPLPRGPSAGIAWDTFSGVLFALQRGAEGSETMRAAGSWLALYTLRGRPVPPGTRELRASVDPGPVGQGLFFRPWDGESDLRIVDRGESRGVVSVRALGDLGEVSFVYLVVDHAPFRGGRAPPLKARISYFDEPGASLRIVYDSGDRSVRVAADKPDTWGAWKEAAVIQCTGTRTWKVVEFDIADALFDGRCNGADLRIEAVSRGQAPAVRAVILAAER